MFHNVVTKEMFKDKLLSAVCMHRSEISENALDIFLEQGKEERKKERNFVVQTDKVGFSPLMTPYYEKI